MFAIHLLSKSNQDISRPNPNIDSSSEGKQWATFGHKQSGLEAVEIPTE